MIWVGIRKLKSDLSKYVGDVRHGEEVIITDRGRPVARIVGDVAPTQSVGEHLAVLAADGLIELPQRPLRHHKGLPALSKGKKASQIILDDRR